MNNCEKKLLLENDIYIVKESDNLLFFRFNDESLISCADNFLLENDHLILNYLEEYNIFNYGGDIAVRIFDDKVFLDYKKNNIILTETRKCHFPDENYRLNIKFLLGYTYKYYLKQLAFDLKEKNIESNFIEFYKSFILDASVTRLWISQIRCNN